MIKIAITGNIGSGKSTISDIFKNYGDPIFSADEAVAKIYTENKIFYEDIRNINPELTINHSVCKHKVIQYLNEKPDFLESLEKLIYPHLHHAREAFFTEYKNQNYQAAICEVPVLFEKNMQHGFDYIILLHCNHDIRWKRVKARPHMTYEKFNLICQNQADFKKYENKADLVIDTARPIKETKEEILKFREKITLGL